jgi:hypothetical protein
MSYPHIVNGITYQRRAWTGGDTPRPDALIPEARNAFGGIRCQLYREQWREYVGYWYEAPGSDVRQTFWRRATYDAWRTITVYYGL